MADTTYIHIHGFDNGHGTNINLSMEIGQDEFIYVVEGTLQDSRCYVFEAYDSYIDAADRYRKIYRDYWEKEAE